MYALYAYLSSKYSSMSNLNTFSNSQVSYYDDLWP